MIKKNTLLLSATILVLLGPLNANESSAARHLARDFKELSSEDIAELDENSEDSEEEEVNKARTKSLIRGYQDNQSIPKRLPHGIYHHWLGCSSDWSIFEMEDGSQWYIAFEDRFRIADWHTSHHLIFRKNKYWDSNSNYKYQIYNTVLDEAIQVNVLDGPYYGGIFTKEIVHADYFWGDVKLTDHSEWCVKSADRHKLKHWKPSHAIILGLNNDIGIIDWLFFSYDYILINIELESSVRAEWEQR